MVDLPRFILIKPVSFETYACYESGIITGHVHCTAEDVFDPFVKIEVEPSKTSEKYYHLRFCQNNRYWGRCASNTWAVAAVFRYAEEDTSKPSCTLFELKIDEDGSLLLTHVQSKLCVSIDPDSRRLVLGGCYVGWESTREGNAFTYVDFDDLVKLPPLVAFKGANNQFLKDSWLEDKEGYQHLQFSSVDGHKNETVQELMTQPDGRVQIKCVKLNRFWRRDDSTNWILADSKDRGDLNTLFTPTKFDDRTIALRCAGNNIFCCPQDRKYRYADSDRTLFHCMQGAASKPSAETRLVILEPVAERNIFHVRYQMEDALVSEKPCVADQADEANHSDKPVILTLKISNDVVASSIFTNSYSLRADVEATFNAGIPYIAEGNIKISDVAVAKMVWGATNESKKLVESSFSIEAPPKSKVTANYVGTQGTCTIPFTYSQKDKSSIDGNYITTHNNHGIFKCVDYYSFRFEELKIEHL